MRRITAILFLFVFLPGCTERQEVKSHPEPAVDQVARPAPPPHPSVLQEPAHSRGQMLVGLASTPAAVPYRLRPEQFVEREFNTEEYGRIEEQPFLRAADRPLSTFAVDVDTASYSNVRRFLREGRLPPRHAVRIEEMINYFSYAYPDPRGSEPFSVTTELADCPWNREHRLLHIGLQTAQIPTASLPPNNLVFLIDVSGSMDAPDKLPLVQSALDLLVEQLREQDRVAIVVYAGASGLVLPSTAGTNKSAIREAIQNLSAGGSTAGGEGLLLAYRTARQHFLSRGNNRVILATDGDFNVGVTSDGELERLITKEREDGIFLTVLGFGTGNIKDSKMELLANKGNGNYAYIDELAEARKVLVEEMGATLLTVAKDVKIQIEFNPARVAAYRLIGYENRALRDQDFNDDRKDAGEIGAGHSVTALYEIVPHGASTKLPDVDPLRYQTRPGAGQSAELATLKIRYKKPAEDASVRMEREIADQPRRLEASSTDFRFSAAVAQLGLLLRESEHRQNASWDGVLTLARNALGDDRRGDRAAFITLAERARSLAR
jgi:Ca-activated chloride channel homolog